jgi:hypothetical protein
VVGIPVSWVAVIRGVIRGVTAEVAAEVIAEVIVIRGAAGAAGAAIKVAGSAAIGITSS